MRPYEMNNTPETATFEEFFNEIRQHEASGRLEAGDLLADRIAEAAPALAEAQSTAGMLAFKRGDIQRALRRLQKAIEIAPDSATYPRNACLIYHATNRLEDALAMANRAIELAPKEAALYFNKSLILHDMHRIDEGLEAIEQALAISPDYPEANFQRAEIQLLAGRFAEGWQSYERRFELEQGKHMLPQTPNPQWDGGKLPEGRLMLVADQGFGDCIQFARYLPWVAERAPKPIMASSIELAPIFAQMKGIGKQVLTWPATEDYDAYIPLSSLPQLAGTTLDTIPTNIPYLSPDPQKVAFWRERLEHLVVPGLKRIGLVWAGRPTHLKDSKRTVSLKQFAPLFARRDIAIITLQKGDRIDEVGLNFGNAQLINLGPSLADFTDTQAVLHCLDRLVTIDTSVAHLAGASGVATSLILPHTPDWRWLLGRDDTPWYPTMRLFRQERHGDWSGVVERVAESL